LSYDQFILINNFFVAGTEQISTSADANFFSMTDTSTTITPFGMDEMTPAPFAAAAITEPLFATTDITQPAQDIFASDLLGDFGEPTKELDRGLISTSPIPGTEFPGNEAYRPEEHLDNFAATTKTIENTGDSFDAFASKFDRAAEPDTNSADPFLDAFGAGPTAMDTSSDGKTKIQDERESQDCLVFDYILFRET